MFLCNIHELKHLSNTITMPRFSAPVCAVLFLTKEQHTSVSEFTHSNPDELDLFCWTSTLN